MFHGTNKGIKLLVIEHMHDFISDEVGNLAYNISLSSQ
jgi:uncharacterized protein (DUF2164 family)